MPKMRRLTSYVAGSTALAAAVIAWAFYERPNFYSAAVYLSQSNACLMILANMALLCGGSILYGFQKLLFGPLRPIEIEQLYERGWFAITEWLFAMSTFRDEFGVSFLVMFSTLFVGKVWGWIAEGRIEALEQQPPVNPRLFHSRLVASLALFVLFSAKMSHYCFETVMYEARPGVMVMFVFEFAIITVSAISTCIRYALWWWEQEVTKRQIKEKVAELKADIRARRERATAEGNMEAVEAAGREEDVAEEEIEVPGWEAKGGWLFALDIGTDFLKLIAYMAFFTVLTVFYGIPIYIIRDMYITLRSFTKRVTDYLKYQRATSDMHRRYPDATAEQLSADNTCIVCREEMRPWQQPEAGAAPAASMPERNRPKRLPCGHILHFGCLRSWLERQQVCPICRRSVLQTAPPTNNRPANQPANANDLVNIMFGNQRAAPAQHDHAGDDDRNAPQAGQQPNAVLRAPGLRTFQLGPFRFQYGQVQLGRPAANGQQPQARTTTRPQHQAMNRPIMPTFDYTAATQPAQSATTAPTASSTSTDPAVQSLRQGLNTALANIQLNEHEAYLRREIQMLDSTMQRVHVTRQLFAELEIIRAQQDRLRQMQQNTSQFPASAMQQHNPARDPLAQTLVAGLPEGMAVPPGYQVVPLAPFSGVAPNPLIPQHHFNAGLQQSMPPPPMFHTVVGPNQGMQTQPQIPPEIAQAFQQMAQQFPMNTVNTVPNQVRSHSTEPPTSAVPPSVTSTVNAPDSIPAEPSVEVTPLTATEAINAELGSTVTATQAAPAPFVAADGWSFPTATNEPEAESTEVSGSQPNGSAHSEGDDRSHAAHQPTVEDAD